jgi:hypothetical protein
MLSQLHNRQLPAVILPILISQLIQFPANPPLHQDMLRRNNTAPFQGWLEGAYVTYIFPAALWLNEEGLLNSDPKLKVFCKALQIR